MVRLLDRESATFYYPRVEDGPLEAVAPTAQGEVAMRFVGDAVRDRDNNFDFLRMLAATGVLVSHSYLVTGGENALQPLQRLLSGLALGTVCVYAFFVMSGFLIARSFAGDPRPDAFILKRSARLIPALVLVTAAEIVLGAVLTSRPLPEFFAAVPEFAIRNLALLSFDHGLPGVFVGNPYGPAITPPLWSLPYEIGCYACLLILGIFGVLKKRGLLLIAAVGFTPFLVLSFFGMMPNLPDLIARYGFMFLLGVLAWVWRDRLPLSTAIFAFVWVGAVFGVFTGTFLNVLLPLAIAYSVIFFAFARCELLANYTRLGDYSYGTYLFAFPIQQIAYDLGLGTTPFSNIAVALPFTLICAALSWHLVEQPVLKGTRSALTSGGITRRAGPVAQAIHKA